MRAVEGTEKKKAVRSLHPRYSGYGGGGEGEGEAPLPMADAGARFGQQDLEMRNREEICTF